MKILLFCPTYAKAMRKETTESIKSLIVPFGVRMTVKIGRDNPFPGEGHKNTLRQYQNARRLALDETYDALFTIEHDMIIPEDALEKLVNTRADVVYGLYLLRHGAAVCNALEFYGPGARNIGESLTLKPELYWKGIRQGWLEVSGVGSGCTLIHRNVLEACELRASGEAYAPDWALATDCQQKGFKQICRFDVKCGHMDEGRVLWPVS